MCKELNCIIKYPIFNLPNEKQGIYCSVHKKEGMVDVKSKTCLECKKIPAFNLPDKNRGIYCEEHKKEGMVNVKSKTCLECKKQPTFNLPGNKTRLYCTEHKKEGMIDIAHELCLNCDIRANFNLPNEKLGIYCENHKKEGMVNIVSKKCLECKKQPTFNLPGINTPIYCSEHKKEGMVNIVCKTCLDCTIQPIFNLPNKKPGIYCSEHKKEGMINVKDKLCISGICGGKIANPKYNNYCLFCFIHLFPNEPITKNYKTKEKAVSDCILKNIQGDWIQDKQILGGCSKRRPDLLLDLGFQIIIVEVDENQHQDYEEICENKRIMLISQDLGHRNVVFIRFNPDEYTSPESKITSCWGYNRIGTMSVKKSKKKEWENRLEKLKETIEYWKNNVSNKLINNVYLFYNAI